MHLWIDSSSGAPPTRGMATLLCQLGSPGGCKRTIACKLERATTTSRKASPFLSRPQHQGITRRGYGRAAHTGSAVLQNEAARCLPLRLRNFIMDSGTCPSLSPCRHRWHRNRWRHRAHHGDWKCLWQVLVLPAGPAWRGVDFGSVAGERLTPLPTVPVNGWRWCHVDAAVIVTGTAPFRCCIFCAELPQIGGVSIPVAA